MNKSEQTSRVKAMCEYLAALGHPVSTVQGYELLARAHGFKNKHVLAGQSGGSAVAVSTMPEMPAGLPLSLMIDGIEVPVWPADSKPYTFDQMVALKWQFNVIIPVPVEQVGDIDQFNDFASRTISGSEGALESLVYTHIPTVNYGVDVLAYQVCAHVSEPGDYFEEAQAAADAQFYGDLHELAKEIVFGAQVVMRSESAPETVQKGVITGVVLLAEIPGTAAADLFLDYATGCGANNDAVNQAAHQKVFDLSSAENQEHLLGAFILGDLKYATKVATRTWSFSRGTERKRIELRFL
jgi:hypothetical protein